MKGGDSTDPSPRGPPPPPQVTETQNWSWDHRVLAGGGSVRNLAFDKRSPNRNVRSHAWLHRLTSQHPHHAPHPLSVPQAARTSVPPGRHSARVQPPHRPCLSSPEPLESLPGLASSSATCTPTRSPPKSSRIFASTRPSGGLSCTRGFQRAGHLSVSPCSSHGPPVTEAAVLLRSPGSSGAAGDGQAARGLRPSLSERLIQTPP